MGPGGVPAVDAVVAAQPELGLVRQAAGQRPLPDAAGPVDVVRVHGARPAGAQQGRCRQAAILAGLVVAPVEQAIRQCGPDMAGQRMGQAAEARLALLRGALGLVLLGDVMALHKDGRHLAILVLQGLEHEVELALLQRRARRTLQPGRHAAADVGRAAVVGRIQQRQKALVGQLGQGLAQRQVDQRTLPHQLPVGRIDQFDHMLRPAQHRHKTRCLLKQLAQEGPLLAQRQVDRLQRIGAVQHTGGHGGGLLRLDPRLGTQAGELGHVHRVLQDEGGRAVGTGRVAVQRDVGGAPVAVFQRAVGAGDGVVDTGQVVGLPLVQHPGQRLAQQAAGHRCRVAGESVEDAPPQQRFSRAQGRLQVGLVHAHDLQLPVQKHVGVGGAVEQGAQVQRGHVGQAVHGSLLGWPSRSAGSLLHPQRLHPGNHPGIHRAISSGKPVARLPGATGLPLAGAADALWALSDKLHRPGPTVRSPAAA